MTFVITIVAQALVCALFTFLAYRRGYRAGFGAGFGAAMRGVQALKSAAMMTEALRNLVLRIRDPDEGE